MWKKKEKPNDYTVCDLILADAWLVCYIINEGDLKQRIKLTLINSELTENEKFDTIQQQQEWSSSLPSL